MELLISDPKSVSNSDHNSKCSLIATDLRSQIVTYLRSLISNLIYETGLRAPRPLVYRDIALLLNLVLFWQIMPGHLQIWQNWQSTWAIW